MEILDDKDYLMKDCLFLLRSMVKQSNTAVKIGNRWISGLIALGLGYNSNTYGGQ